MSRRALPLLLAVLPALAWAEPQDDAAGSGPVLAPEAPEAERLPLAERFVWERRRGLGERVAGVVVAPVSDGYWLAIDERGGVWRSEDAGMRWANVLRPLGGLDDGDLPDDEELLLEAESRRDEAVEESGADDPEEVTADPASDGTEAEPEAPETDASALEEAGALAADLASERAERAATLPLLWIEASAPDEALAARADGIWRSTDGGLSWEKVRRAEEVDPGIACFARSPDGALVLGTSDGVRYSTDHGATWIDVEDATDGALVHAVVAESGYLWAATDHGLFRSVNGLSWEGVALPVSADVRAVVADAAWDKGFWVATDRQLFRTDDGGATFYVAGRQPLRGLRGLVQLEDAGHLLAISDDGVWESMDGGVAWITADRRLGEPEVRTLAFADGRPVVATPNGVWRMAPPRESLRKPPEAQMLSLADTIRVSTERSGLDMDMLSLTRASTAAKLAPAFEFKFDWGSAARRVADYTSASTTDSYDKDWSVGANLCWGACTSLYAVYDATAGSYDPGSERSLQVIDGKVFDEGEPVAAAANVAQTIRSYRRYLAEHVADAWLARAQLVAQRSTSRSIPIREQVLQVLQLQELDARLDALTDGAFSRSLQIPPASEVTP